MGAGVAPIMSQRRLNARDADTFVCKVPRKDGGGVGARRRGRNGVPIYRHLPNDSRPWRNRPIRSFFRRGGGEMVALSIIAGEKLCPPRVPKNSNPRGSFDRWGILFRGFATYRTYISDRFRESKREIIFLLHLDIAANHA